MADTIALPSTRKGRYVLGYPIISFKVRNYYEKASKGLIEERPDDYVSPSLPSLPHVFVNMWGC